jgi:2-polyprenyl-3-methyl-5-hydroxy-6-metoxy-1,4-benzoquinol methylase
MLSPDKFLEIELSLGISLDNEQFNELAKETINQLSNLEIKTILDYGAGVGAYSKAAIDKGYDVCTFEIWDEHKEYMKSKIDNINLVNKPITTDLMLFIETAEHMTDKELNALFKSIKPKYILFSSTSTKADNDVEWGHINLKTQLEWIEYFKTKGYEFVKDMAYPTQWTKLFKLI